MVADFLAEALRQVAQYLVTRDLPAIALAQGSVRMSARYANELTNNVGAAAAASAAVGKDLILEQGSTAWTQAVRASLSAAIRPSGDGFGNA
ncbi:hypothetical protein [Nonomuraea sp. 10N515B]|uniref:hypothetical protein n=1 Tax=Nonomuraea sp. 10N515B TaxID=3457422 RepID=UPI003FCDE79A